MIPVKAGHASIRIDEGGLPWLRAFRCDQCAAVMADETIACRKCAAREATQAIRVTPQGRLHAWTVVHRSYPGVVVPFVSAIVDLDDGLTLKGTLRGIDPTSLAAELPVRLVFDDAGGATDKDGTPFVGFHFTPLQGAGE
jgi:uncharacterized OB-fold protein